MFVVAQMPIADFRTFSSTSSGARLLAPSWPPRTGLPPQFVRFFGKAVDRHRGVDYAWMDEASFCRAHRALRFPKLPEGGDGWKGNLYCAFRRLLGDGRAIARFEVGLSLLSPMLQSALWKRWDFEVQSGNDPFESAMSYVDPSYSNVSELISYILALPTSVPHLDEKSGKPKVKPMIQQGGELSELYFRATTRMSRKEVDALGRGWLNQVAPGSPVVLVECATKHLDNLPKSFALIPPAVTGGIPLAFGAIGTQWGRVDAWVLGCSSAKSAEIRSLRICLLRLHAEQQVLALVLDRLRSGAINYQQGGANAELLEEYLNDATRVIDRKSWAGIQQSEILAAFDAMQATPSSLTQARLGQQLEGMKLQVKRKVESFERRAERSITVSAGATYVEVQMNQEKVINIGAGATINAPVVIADHIENSFNALAAPGVNADVKAIMEQLLKQIAEVAKQAPNEASKELSENVEVLAKEVAREQPRRKWYELTVDGLKEAATAVGEIGKPILESVGKLLPLLVALWP